MAGLLLFTTLDNIVQTTNTEGTIQLTRSLLELAPLAAGWSMHSMQYFDWRMGELCTGCQCCIQNIFITQNITKNNLLARNFLTTLLEFPNSRVSLLGWNKIILLST